jgi:hypothetical protein
MKTTLFALVAGFGLSFGLTFLVGEEAGVGPVAKDCKSSGAACKFGSECCSKICKASYTCK